MAGRYEILLNKIPESIPEEKTKVHHFGFEQDFQARHRQAQEKKQRIFYLAEGERARIGFVHEEGFKNIFSGAFVHFYGKRRFLCQSNQQHKAICCTHEYSGKNPSLRIAVPIIQYADIRGERHFEIMPWIFGKVIYNTMKDWGSRWSADTHDLTIIAKEHFNFNMYDIIPAGDSLWRHFTNRDRILLEASDLRENIMPFLGEDLDESSIESILNQDPTNWPERPRAVSRRDLFPEPEGSPMAPLTEPTALRDLRMRELDNVLEGLEDL